LPVTLVAEIDTEWGASLGVVNTDYDTGLNASLSYIVNRSNARFTLNLIDLNMFSGDAEGFRNETLSNGNEVCRNESDGQFAKKEECEKIDFDLASSVEAGYIFSSMNYPLILGIGVRIFGDKEFGGNSVTYLKVMLFNKANNYFGSFKYSPDYNQLSIGAVF